jgi:mannose/fructose/N-acetylgalactosamine-specific phosphotransferase system component IID
MWRSFFVQVFWNYRRMQGDGFLFALFPFLRRMESDPEKQKSLMRRSSGFMNTHPCLAPLAMGAMLRRMAGEQNLDEHEWQTWREGLCGPLGVTGDSLIWDGLKPLVFVLATVLLLLFGSPQSILPLVFSVLLLYNLPAWGLRLWGAQEGWNRGEGVLQALEDPFFKKAARWRDRIGAVLVGVLLVVSFSESALFVPLAIVQFVFGFLFLWACMTARWPLISSIIIAVAFVPFSVWVVQWLSPGGL